MSIFCIGVNHKTAPIEIRERLAFPEKAVPDHLREICGTCGIAEVVVLSTCNRVEIYGSAEDTSGAISGLTNYLFVPARSNFTAMRWKRRLIIFLK